MQTMQWTKHFFVISLLLGGSLLAENSSTDMQRQIVGQPKMTADTPSTTKPYAGNLFEVRYPTDFTPSIAMKHQGQWYYAPTDEATFLSPDKEVAFFIYSPHWGGEPKNYHKVVENEVLVSKEIKHSRLGKHQSTTVTYVALRDKQRRYYRSYAYKVSCYVNDDGSQDSCVATTFGIRYKDKEAYNKYKKAYIQFKKSLIKSMPE